MQRSGTFHDQSLRATAMPRLQIRSDWLSRRMSSPRLRTRNLEKLPADILILIFCHCRVDELLSLRLTSRSICDLIEDCIATIAPAVARSTFPLNDRVINHPVDPSLYSISWVKNLIPRQLASILVDRGRFNDAFNRLGIPAEEPWGDEMRARVANGWCVFRRLTKISEDVYRMEEKDVLDSEPSNSMRILHPLRSKSNLLRQREELVLDRRLAYIETLDHSMTRDYKMMMILLSATFRPSPLNTGEDHVPWVFDFGYGIDGPRLIRRGSSWLAWYILNQGPDLFWQQWWMNPAEHYIRDRSVQAWFDGSNTSMTGYIRKCALREWVDVNEEWHTLQREHATAVQSLLHEKASHEPGGFSSFDPMSYFRSYSSYRRKVDGDGAPAATETLGKVPFHVEFASWMGFQECREPRGREVIIDPNHGSR